MSEERAGLGLLMGSLAYAIARLLDAPRLVYWVPGSGPTFEASPQAIGWYGLVLYGFFGFLAGLALPTGKVGSYVIKFSVPLTVAALLVLSWLEASRWIF
ncbi:MAG: hypothetical protein HY791_28220 [Deltaproteobacteria bacterium]|nr:hypothetical protein [Deltaproteobacteria bacterium]